jgi:hypothetical protein
MRWRYTIALFALVVATSVRAQQAPTRASRSDGSIVILFPNGTWRPDSTVASSVAAGAGKEYTTPVSDSSVLEIGHGVRLRYDPAKWQTVPSTIAGRQQLRNVSGDGYAMTIFERIAVPMSTLRKIVLTNARNAAPDAAITFDEMRKVNGVSVEAMQISGTTQGIPFRYFGYYFAGKSGTIQILTYTGASLFAEYKPDFEELLNGLQIDEQ